MLCAGKAGLLTRCLLQPAGARFAHTRPVNKVVSTASAALDGLNDDMTM
jgi:hypothetical protein